MKIAVAVCVVALVAAVSGQTYGTALTDPTLDLSAPALSDDIIEMVNSDSSIPWTARRNEFFEGKTLGDVAAMLMQDDYEAYTSTLPVAPVMRYTNAPDEFDGRSDAAWFNCPETHVVRDQARCGSCWSFSMNEAMGIRFCIASEGAVNVPLSPQYQVSCDRRNAGCSGGSGPASNKFYVETGSVPDSCVGYVSGSGSVPPCPDACDDGSALTHYKANDDTEMYPNDEETLRAKYYEHGPSYTRFDVYSDFMNYGGGVYVHTSGGRLGGHAIIVVGWGQEDGLDYWLCANSWGASWGIEGGYFKIARGQNECGIDAGNVGSTPDLSTPGLF
eukprot:TRINITY_DN24507_c0_g1_i1.p1 TRINITY_DN24507_c0_g1~~TRINITY_DN24507_c0_g1_i1.p1  ORF type:complete len:338 (+),score=36.78 TRINITY_DN24507_c0_g1_i1:24-1016(+)